MSLKHFLVGWILFFSLPSVAAVPTSGKNPNAKLVTKSAGRVGDKFVTTREVLANSLIEDTLFRAGKEKKIFSKGFSDRAFIQEVTAILLEIAIAKEGRDLPLAKVSSSEMQSAKDSAMKKLKSIGQWRDLRFSDSEMDQVLRTKLSAKKFLEFKLSSSNLPVSDTDAETYYKNNKFKFDNVPFESLKENIKAFMRKRQVDERLREWFEVLKIKYSIRNQLAEKA